MFKRAAAAIILIILFSQLSFAQNEKTSLTIKDIMADPPIEGTRPSSAEFSPDGKYISYFWGNVDSDTTRHFYITPSDKNKPEILLKELHGMFFWTKDSKSIVYTDKKDLFKIDIADKKITQVSKSGKIPSRFTLSKNKDALLFSDKSGIWHYSITDGKMNQLTLNSGFRLSWSPDEKKAAYQFKGNIYIVDIDTKTNIQITSLPEKPEEHNAKRVSRFAWSPNSEYLLISFRKGTVEDRKIIVPQYLGKFVRTKPGRNSFAGDPPSETEAGIFSCKTKSITFLDLGTDKKFYLFGTFWAPDSKSILLNIQSGDFHSRFLVLAYPGKNATDILDKEEDPAWIAPLSHMISWLKGGSSFLFTSERSGYNHIFRLNLNKRKPVQLTSGDWQVSSYTLLPDSQRLVYSSTEVSPTQRHFYLMDSKSGKVEKLNTQKGYNSRITLSKDGSEFIYQHAEYALPYDYYILKTKPSAKPVRITSSIPKNFKKIQWVKPKLVTFANVEDNVSVNGYLFEPPGLDKTKKYPVILFIHGAGYLQNVVENWTPYEREYKFHHLMVQKGYLVLDIDYRGSSGYSRDFRTGVYLHMGGKDLSDLVSGIEYLKNIPYADTDRVGCYGGSYGGFLTLMALCLEPEYFKCGAALRSVTDWKNYNAYYTNQRLGYPKDHPEAYRISSPISFAEQLTRPLLLMHGLVDDNVFSQDSFQFAEKLIKAGIDFEFMVYPSQRHGFTDPASWTDEYSRIERLFEKYLK